MNDVSAAGRRSASSESSWPSAVSSQDQQRWWPAMPTGKPTTSASSDRRASAGRRCTIATHSPASGPNSGPTTIAPTTRIGWSSSRPNAAIMRGDAHEHQVGRRTASTPRSCAPRPPPTRPRRCPARGRLLGRRAASDRDRLDLVGRDRPEPHQVGPFRVSSTSLAASRATSASTRSPAGSSATPGRWTTLVTAGDEDRQSSTALDLVGRHDEAQVQHGANLR